MMKRSSDIQMSNGNYTMETEMNPDAKKPKMDNKPSRVIHIRGVPLDATEGEVIQLGLPFGRMTNMVLARKKNQALLEMSDIATAQAMVKYYTERPPQIRLHTMYVQFSNHDQLKTDNSTSQNMSTQAALQAADQMLGSMDANHTVLRIMVDNMLYPITIDILKQIFSKYGQVLKVVLFNKNNSFQALLQYSDALAAQGAKVSLNGQNIYNGCCTLRIDFSRLPELNVKYNNDKSWDFTNPNLPSGDVLQQQMQQQGMMENTGDGLLGQFGSGPMFNNFGGMPGANMNFGMQPGMQQRMGGMGMGMGGGMQGMGVGGMGNPMGGMAAGMPGMGSGMGGGMGGLMGSGMNAGMGGGMGAGMGGMPPGMSGMDLMNAMGGAMGAMGMGMGGMGGMGPAGGGMGGMGPMHGMPPAGGMSGGGQHPSNCVVIASNLDEENVKPDAVFTLFGMYGIVQRVKIMYNKKDTALIQFADPVHAQNAIVSLDKLRWQGKNLKVSLSKHTHVQLPKEGLPEAWLTKDYTNSPLHRFKNPSAKSYTNVYPPTCTLHLSNIPASVTEDELTDLFNQYGQVCGFKFFDKDRKMALMQMESQEQAVDALVNLHNYRFESSSYLRVSFTKSTIHHSASY